MADDLELVYHHEPGFPDLKDKARKPIKGPVLYEDVATYAGKIVNRELQPGEQVFRVFGPAGKTHGQDVANSYASGRPGGNSFWGLNEVPSDAKTWREGSAVLDEWHRDGFLVVGTVMPGHTLPACTGLVAEQAGKDIGAQYLPGGGKQAMVKLPAEVAGELGKLGTKVQSTGYEVIELGGVRWELRATGWSDVNGIHGYLRRPGPGSVQVARLGARTLASKTNED